MNVIKAPNPIRLMRGEPTFFLAGSIEMGTAVNWQDQAAQELQRAFPDTGTILNPRRDHWDPTLKQDPSNPVFRQQVEWELGAMELCDLIGVYFDPATKSPITLLELGLHARSGKLVVCCPKGFWRRGNVEIVCNRYSIDQVHGGPLELAFALASKYRRSV